MYRDFYDTEKGAYLFFSEEIYNYTDLDVMIDVTKRFEERYGMIQKLDDAQKTYVLKKLIRRLELEGRIVTSLETFFENCFLLREKGIHGIENIIGKNPSLIQCSNEILRYNIEFIETVAGEERSIGEILEEDPYMPNYPNYKIEEKLNNKSIQ